MVHQEHSLKPQVQPGMVHHAPHGSTGAHQWAQQCQPELVCHALQGSWPQPQGQYCVPAAGPPDMTASQIEQDWRQGRAVNLRMAHGQLWAQLWWGAAGGVQALAGLERSRAVPSDELSQGQRCEEPHVGLKLGPASELAAAGGEHMFSAACSCVGDAEAAAAEGLLHARGGPVSARILVRPLSNRGA